MSITRPDRYSPCQRGFSIVAAIFILVVLAGLGAFLVSISTTQSQTQAQDVMNSRASQAARAGLEWALFQLVKASPAPVFRTGCEASAASYSGATPATQSFAAGTFPGLAEMQVDVVCRSQSHTEGANTYRVYQLVATACNAAACPAATPGFGYVEHQQTATVRQ
jgi:MSHA biogenesis protein MshP